MGNMKAIAFLALLVLACLSHKAHADSICTRECPRQCQLRNTEAHEIECFFFCVISCEHCPNSATGCPPDEETKKKLEKAKMTGLQKLLKEQQKMAPPRKVKN